MSDPVLQAEGIVRTFGGVKAVDGVTLRSDLGEWLGVIGQNGAGKTTLLNCISGTLKVQAGSVRLKGKDITNHTPHRIFGYGVARTLQLAEHFKGFTVIEFVLLGRIRSLPLSIWKSGFGIGGSRTAEKREREVVEGLLAHAGLDTVRNIQLRNLPYGDQRLADIVRAVAAEPILLLLDEPTSGSSDEDRLKLRGFLKSIHSANTSVIVVDHDVEFVSSVCDRIMAMSLGRELATGSPEDVLSHPEVIETYLGRPHEGQPQLAPE